MIHSVLSEQDRLLSDWMDEQSLCSEDGVSHIFNRTFRRYQSAEEELACLLEINITSRGTFPANVVHSQANIIVCLILYYQQDTD